MLDSQEKIEVGSETGIEQDLPSKAKENKSEFDWLASIKRIFINLVDIVKAITRWQ
tara:strand:- start:1166 stop:1333 length:168 start_codon:yes stop_codon:yes gene_type:complete